MPSHEECSDPGVVSGWNSKYFQWSDTSYLVTTVLFVSLSIQLAPGGARTGIGSYSIGRYLPSCVESGRLGRNLL